MLEIRDFCAWLRSRFAPLQCQPVRRLLRGVRTAPRIRDRTPPRTHRRALYGAKIALKRENGMRSRVAHPVIIVRGHRHPCLYRPFILADLPLKTRTSLFPKYPRGNFRRKLGANSPLKTNSIYRPSGRFILPFRPQGGKLLKDIEGTYTKV